MILHLYLMIPSCIKNFVKKLLPCQLKIHFCIWNRKFHDFRMRKKIYWQTTWIAPYTNALHCVIQRNSSHRKTKENLKVASVKRLNWQPMESEKQKLKPGSSMTTYKTTSLKLLLRDTVAEVVKSFNKSTGSASSKCSVSQSPWYNSVPWYSV